MGQEYRAFIPGPTAAYSLNPGVQDMKNGAEFVDVSVADVDDVLHLAGEGLELGRGDVVDLPLLEEGGCG